MYGVITETMKRKFTLCLALGFLALIFGALVPQVVYGQGSRDQYSVVEASRLNQHPQRYWSRGVVFEDTFTGITGRTRNIDGRRVIEIQTRSLDNVYADARLEDRIQRMRHGQYVFSGTVLSESRRFLRWSRTTYRVVVDSIERVDEGQPDDLLDLFAGDEVGVNLGPMLEILAEAQRRLIVEARNEGIPIESMFDAQMPRGDRAIEIARASVRRIEREAGLPAAEIISLLIREVMVAQQGLLATHATEPIPVPEIEILEPEAEPIEELQQEEEPVHDHSSVEEEVQSELVEDLPSVSEAWGDEPEVETVPMPESDQPQVEEPNASTMPDISEDEVDSSIAEPDTTFGLQPSEAPLRLRDIVPLRTLD